MNAQHTPTPWGYEAETLGGGWTPAYQRIAISAGEFLIANYSTEYAEYPSEAECEANAAHIVKCVNSHDTLMAALKEAAKLAWEVGCETEDGVMTLLEDSRGDLYRQITAALAAAGETP